MNYVSFRCTQFWGTLLIVPCFCMITNCWKKYTFAKYDIAEAMYSSLEKLVKGTKMQSISLSIEDNCFGAKKAEILLNVLTGTALKKFSLFNLAKAIDYEEN